MKSLSQRGWDRLLLSLCFRRFRRLELLAKSVDFLYKLQIILYVISPLHHLTFICHSDKIIFDKKYTERNE